MAKSLTYKLGLDASGFERGIKGASSEVKSFAKDLSSHLGAAGSVMAKMGPGALAVGAAMGAMAAAASAVAAATAHAVSSLLEEADALDRLSQQSKLSTDFLQVLGVSAKAAGMTMEDAGAAALKMQKALGDGSTVFQRLGLSMAELKRMAPDEAFRKVAAAVMAIEDPMRRTAAEIEVFGKSGAAIEPLLAGLGAAEEASKKFGLTLSAEAIAKAAALDDQIDFLVMGFENLSRQWAATIIDSGVLQDAVAELTEVLAGVSTWVKDNGPALSAGFKAWGTAIKETWEWAVKLHDAIDALSKTPLFGATGGGVGVSASADMSSGFKQPTLVQGPLSFVTKGEEAAALKARVEATKLATEANKEFFKTITDLVATDEAGWLAQVEAGFRAEADAVEDALNETLRVQEVLDALNGHVEKVTSGTEKWGKILGTVSNAFVTLGVSGNSTLGKIGTSIGSIGSGLSALASAKNLTGLDAILGKFSGWVGIIGGAIVALKIFWNLFSGGPKSTWYADQQKAFEEAWAKKQAAAGAGILPGATAMTGIQILTPADAQAQASIAAMTFWQVFREKGLVAAGEAFKDLVGKLNESIAAIGGDAAAEALLGPINQVVALAGNEAFSGAADAAQGLADVLNGFVMNQLPMSATQFAAFGQQAQSAFDQAKQAAIDSGMSIEEAQSAAFLAISPLLAALVAASEQYGFTLDANTQSLIDQAKESGTAFASDPVSRLIAEIEKLIQAILGIPDKKVNVKVHTTYTSSGEPSPGLPGGVPEEPESEGEAPPTAKPSAAGGAVLWTPTPVVAGDAGAGNPEVIAPVKAMLKHIGEALRGGSPWADEGGVTVVNWNADGAQLDRLTLRRKRAGHR